MKFFKDFSKKELILFVLMASFVLMTSTFDVVLYGVFTEAGEKNVVEKFDSIVDLEDAVDIETETYIEETVEPVTEPITEAPTEAPTEPPTEPVTEPPTQEVVVISPVYYGEAIELPMEQWETEIVNIMLDVPDYKQYDDRWGDVYISTKTIRNVGCLVTALSEVYTYNNSITVYPDGMLSMVGFYGNLLEWHTVPEVGLKYTHQYKSNVNQNIMNNIYKRLKEGRPVIIGGTNPSGGMHWVVVKGYNVNAEGTMIPANFLINDPYGTQKLTLADFFAEYPWVERLVY